jgi:hypothetical protein
MPEDPPLLFISHKHADAAIAQVVASFIENRSNGTVRVHLSSSPDFAGPKFGKGLNAQLRETLWKTRALILVYTSQDADWSYCMWECGVATHPQSPDTSIIVFQCGTDVPSPFADMMRVNLRKFEDVKRFTDQFLRSATFFPGSDRAIAPGLKDQHIENASRDFFEELSKILPPVDDGQVEEWSSWPFLRLEIPRSEVDRIDQASEAERLAAAQAVVREHAVVVDNDARAAQIFGRAGFPSRTKFTALLKDWQDKFPAGDSSWFESCCEQIMAGARRGFPVIRWTPMRDVSGPGNFTPVVARVRRLAYARVFHFDVYFYDLSDPRAIPVTSKMLPFGKFFCQNVGASDPTTIKLRDLVNELNSRRLNRLPILDTSDCVKYMVHRSLIEQFIVKRVLSPEPGSSPDQLSLADLLGDQELRTIFENTFVTVAEHATLAEAKTAMVDRPGCSDVFITKLGSRTEPILGWLTNVDIAQNT